jgi:hypothetical protein
MGFRAWRKKRAEARAQEAYEQESAAWQKR